MQPWNSPKTAHGPSQPTHGSGSDSPVQDTRNDGIDSSIDVAVVRCSSVRRVNGMIGLATKPVTDSSIVLSQERFQVAKRGGVDSKGPNGEVVKRVGVGTIGNTLLAVQLDDVDDDCFELVIGIQDEWVGVTSCHHPWFPFAVSQACQLPWSG